jgi:hypothetical protein
MGRKNWFHRAIVAALVVGTTFGGPLQFSSARADEVLPKHITPETLKAVRAGLEYLARVQGEDGAWREGEGGREYPIAMTGLACMPFLAQGNTTTRGRYAPQLDRATDFLLKCSTKSGLITGTSQEGGRPMYGHGFGMLALATIYGSESKPARRNSIRDVLNKGINLTATGQSADGGWTYIPGGGDEGSVTVTQVQALRACENAGFDVPKGTIEKAVRYIERCKTPEGGICYSLGSGGGAMLAISAAAPATLYNAGQYDAPVATQCLEFVWTRFQAKPGWNKATGHDYYAHFYAAQAFYMAGDKYWDEYFPKVRDELIKMQSEKDGSWNGDYIGQVYGTSMALVILQLPYKFLPIYQR